MYNDGVGTAQDARKAFAWVQKSAENGFCWGEYNLACFYDKGIGCKANEEKAFRWYGAAVDNEHSKRMDVLGDAKRELGTCYWLGKGIDVDQEMAGRLWSEAYEDEDDQESAYWLGQYYEEYEEDNSKAVEMYEAAIEYDKDDMYSLFYLGQIYYFGENGIGQNYQKAYNYIKRAAELDYPKAQTVLGLMFDKGQHVKENPSKANEWYKKAMAQGEAQAMYFYAVNLFAGRGVTQNEIQALRMMQQAADAGYTEAQEFLDEYNSSSAGFGNVTGAIFDAIGSVVMGFKKLDK